MMMYINIKRNENFDDYLLKRLEHYLIPNDT